MSELDRLLNRLDAEVSDPYMGDVGVRVWDERTGRDLFTHHAEKSYMMASTAKIFTIGAALSLLGEGFRIGTEVYASGALSPGGDLQGDLCLRGGGDPSFGSAEYVKKFFYGRGTQGEALIEVLRRAGVRRVQGAVVADVSAFDEQVRPTGRLSALTYGREQAEEPALVAAEKITAMLEDSGIEVGRPARRGALPEDARLLGSLLSPPLRELIIPMGRRSDNFIAETLGKLLAFHTGGGEATTEAGAAIIREFVAGLGVDIHQVDGSGLAFRNKATPSGVVDYLREMTRQPYAAAFMESLPVMGVNGTIHDRGRNTAAQGLVSAKTGTHLTPGTNQMDRGFRSSALSGFCGEEADGRLVFSIMQERPKSRYSALAGQERIVTALAQYAATGERS